MEKLFGVIQNQQVLMNQNIIILKKKYSDEKTSLEFFEMDKEAKFINDIKQDSFIDRSWFPDTMKKKNVLGNFAKILSPHSFKDAQIKNFNLTNLQATSPQFNIFMH